MIFAILHGKVRPCSLLAAPATAEYRPDRNDHAPVAQWVEQRIYIPSAPDKRLVPVRARPPASSGQRAILLSMAATKHAERSLARALRAEGRSMKEIARLVGVSVASVSCWVRDVPLTSDQRAELLRRMSANGRAAAAAGRSRAAREVRRSYQERGRRQARRRRPLHAAGCTKVFV